MQITTTQLNQVASLIGSTDKNTVLTVAIGVLVKSGVAIDVAMNAVLGEGAYEKLASDVYHTLRAA